MHPFDLLFYNRSRTGAGSYTTNRYLDDLDERYGGIDSMLIWPSYPLLGIDDRNQFDMFDALPGGVVALRRAVVDLRARGVRTLLPYLPWDSYTRPDAANRTDPERMADLILRVDADGANADSVLNVAEAFYTSTVVAGDSGRAAAWQAENGPNSTNPTALNWQVMDIGYWGGSADGNYTGGGGGDWPVAPSVDKWKFFDPRRVTVVSDRWNKNKTDNLQAAFFNGDAYEAWENVWGCWNGITERDSAALRRVATMLRFFSSLGFTASPGWEPHTPELAQGCRLSGAGSVSGERCSAPVFASKWPLPERNETLWTIVNRADRDAAGVQLRLDGTQYSSDGWFFYDCYRGTELAPVQLETATQLRGRPMVAAPVILTITIEGSGFGCVFATRNASTTAAGGPLARYLDTMRSLTAVPLRMLSPVWHPLLQIMLPSPHISDTRDPSPRGMVLLPAGSFDFVSDGVEIEDRSDVQFPWEGEPTKQHRHTLAMPAFWVDATLVTTSEYQAYIDASGYRPVDAHNWLRNWVWAGNVSRPRLPAALARLPVTYVSYREAAAFCAFHNKRLPQAYEWQYAAQGSDVPGRTFPWSMEDDPSCHPVMSRGRTIAGAHPVNTFPVARCASPFNVSDLVGNVWQFTSSFSDEHTATVLLKGGSNYFPVATSKAKWYFKNTWGNLSQHNKMFLMDDAFERAGTVGFRCVRDVAGTQGVQW
eukprot:g3880.t1